MLASDINRFFFMICPLNLILLIVLLKTNCSNFSYKSHEVSSLIIIPGTRQFSEMSPDCFRRFFDKKWRLWLNVCLQKRFNLPLHHSAAAPVFLTSHRRFLFAGAKRCFSWGLPEAASAIMTSSLSSLNRRYWRQSKLKVVSPEVDDSHSS